MLDVPFVQYNGYNVVHTEISADARGTSRPMHEVLYWHYAMSQESGTPMDEIYIDGRKSDASGMGSAIERWREVRMTC